MGVSIKSEEAERKLRRVSRLLGKSMTATVIDLADGRLKEIDAKRDRERIHRSVERIVRRVRNGAESRRSILRENAAR